MIANSPNTLFICLKGLIIPLFLCFSGTINAQQDFRPGYIITRDMDTLYGEIDYRGDILMSTTCRFKAPETKKIKTYTPDDLFGFRFTDSKYYVAETLETGERLFLQYLVNGKLSVFYYRDKEGKDHYLINKMGLPLRELPYSEGIISRKDGNDLFKQSYFHMGLLKVYTRDAPEIQKEILRIKKPDSRNLIKLAEDYQKRVCNNKVCIIYEKKQPFLSVSADLFYGITNFRFLKGYSNAIGTNIYFWMPRANDKIFLKTGIAYEQIEWLGSSIGIYKIPFQIMYVYSMKIIKPKAAIGANFVTSNINYEFIYSSLNLDAGFNVELTNWLSLSTSFGADFVPLSLSLLLEDVKFDILSYDLELGFYVKF